MTVYDPIEVTLNGSTGLEFGSNLIRQPDGYEVTIQAIDATEEE
jgi:hypothetical protein